MVSPSATVLPSSPIAGWRLPALGVLLTGLGLALLSAGMRELAAPARPAWPVASSTVVVAPIPGHAAPMAPPRSEAWSEAGDAARPGPGRSRRSADCLGADLTVLGADLATGRRAESAHLATVALRLADCGDARDALMASAALSYKRFATEAAPPAEGIDLAAAALYGPPDRQPRTVLEETAASRLLGPR